MQQNVVALLQLFLRQPRLFFHPFDRLLRQRHHLSLPLLLLLLLQVGLHGVERSQQAAVEDVADEGALFARILHREHRKRAVFASFPRDRRDRRGSAGIRFGQEARKRGVQKRARNESENASGMTLLLKGRENQNLAETKRMRRRLEGIGEDVEKAKPRQTGALVDGSVEREHEPAVRGILGYHDFAGAVDEPIAERLDVFEELDGAGGGERVEIEGEVGGVRGVGFEADSEGFRRFLDLRRVERREESVRGESEA